ncbi:hypothetical protein GCM10011326_28760 [Salipiger profundus]|uniref:Uncharacterized protein n=1 Tax=Salipiger profundus TaxID=1229727 RepID=A0A1U7DA67_9RHOB|nr:hypothetical protein Ga0080559_TMP4206 [Salipiger profundus]GGA14777.1 hypothetical protein GCM10011326_28760 [Salipiger profundus]
MHSPVRFLTRVRICFGHKSRKRGGVTGADGPGLLPAKPRAQRVRPGL